MSQDCPASPLKAGKKEIRVVKLQPIAGDSAFEASCILHTVSLLQEPKPHYSALPYVWGDPTETKSILLNDREHRVPKNLAAALKFLTVFRRDRPHDFHLWVDAICVNQNIDPENHEKNGQVAMMGDIFAIADEVLAWLGENASIPKYFHTLVALHKQSISTERNDEVEKSLQFKAYPELYAQDIPGNEKWLIPNQSWKSIRNFVELPYWSRSWIFQELVLAKPGQLLFFNVGTHRTILYQRGRPETSLGAS